MSTSEGILPTGRSPVLVFYNKNEKPYIAVPHLHTQLEIYYNIRGGRSFFIDGKFYDCRPRDLFIIPSLQIHKALIHPQEPYERCIVSLDTPVITALETLPSLSDGSLGETFRAVFHPDDPSRQKVSLSEAEHARFLTSMEAYNRATGEPARWTALIGLLCFVRQKLAESHPAMPETPPTLLSDRIICYIESHFREPLSAEDVATHLHFDKKYLNRAFKKEANLTVKEYVLRRRIAEAKKHIYCGHSVKEACYHAGFQDYANFIRTFKNYEGYSPGKLERLSEPL